MEIFRQILGFEDVNYHGPNVYESLNVNFADWWWVIRQTFD